MEIKEKSIKNKKAGQTLKEWFLFSRFQDHIKRPFFMIWYYLHIFVATVAPIAVLVLFAINFNDEHIRTIVMFFLCLLIMPSAIIFLIYKDRNSSSGWNYYKWTSFDKK